jgi:hypothetical protein
MPQPPAVLLLAATAAAALASAAGEILTGKYPGILYEKSHLNFLRKLY